MSPARPLPRGEMRALYRRLQRRYGRLDWWPAKSRFEILVGAVLTQNTAWRNVELALVRLRAAGWTGARAILAAPRRELAEALRPSGYFNLKSERLSNLCRWFEDAGGFRRLDRWPTGRLRDALLSVNGIGPETADDILLYAFDRPVFVVDAYTRRILARLGLLADRPGYEVLRQRIEHALPADVAVYKQYHALIVEHAKHSCRPRPRCSGCGLAPHCMTARMA
jgi:endonuclease-3 related protein